MNSMNSSLLTKLVALRYKVSYPCGERAMGGCSISGRKPVGWLVRSFGSLRRIASGLGDKAQASGRRLWRSKQLCHRGPAERIVACGPAVNHVRLRLQGTVRDHRVVNTAAHNAERGR